MLESWGLAMTETEALKLALEALEKYAHDFGSSDLSVKAMYVARNALVQPEQEPKCNSHPKAPHGFNRNASHSNDRYTCECEGWDAYEAGYQDGLQKGFETEPEQEPVAWLGFNERGECREVFTTKMKETFPNYPTKDMTPVYTIPPQPEQEPCCYGGIAHDCHAGQGCRIAERLKAAPKPEQEPVATLDDLEQEIYENTRQFVSRDVMEWMLKRYYTTPPQRKPLTDKQKNAIVHQADENDWHDYDIIDAVEAAHGITGEKNG